MPTLGNAGYAGSTERITATVRAEELPRGLLVRFSSRPEPGALYVLTAEPAHETDQEKIAALREHVLRGVADADAGRLHDDQEVFGDLQTRYPDL